MCQLLDSRAVTLRRVCLCHHMISLFHTCVHTLSGGTFQTYNILEKRFPSLTNRKCCTVESLLCRTMKDLRIRSLRNFRKSAKWSLFSNSIKFMHLVCARSSYAPVSLVDQTTPFAAVYTGDAIHPALWREWSGQQD